MRVPEILYGKENKEQFFKLMKIRLTLGITIDQP